MVIPSTLIQAILVLLLVLPGTVYQAVRARVRGPSPDDASATNRVLRALAASAVLDMVYALVFGRALIPLVTTSDGVVSRDVVVDRSRSLAWWALLLLVVIPAGSAVAWYWFTTQTLPSLRSRHPRLPRLSYNPTPRAWDFGFQSPQQGYVRVLYEDGTYQGGFFGADSYATSYPEARELFLEKAWQLETDGSFKTEVAGSAGLFIPCDKVKVVELLSAQPPPPTQP